MKHAGACGVCCDVCELHKKLGCVCSSGIEEIAKEKVRTHGGGGEILCLVLDCTVKRGIACCRGDCK